MTYADALKFLYGLQLFGANFGLERTRRLAELAGDPQSRLKFIHVAGTNGKGSVCAMLESIYRTSGRRTGLFTSPHLVHFGERMQIDRQLPSRKEVVRLVETLRQILREGARRDWWDDVDHPPAGGAGWGHPTFFEVVTIMALIHFAEHACDLVLWETGLGGRLDATNIVTPLASVITTISLEHTAVLGESTAKIAAEKSGIIKPRIPVVAGIEDAEALRVLRQVATSRNAPFTAVSGKFALPTPEYEPKIANDEAGLAETFAPGYQRANARLALAVTRILESQLPVQAEHRTTGLHLTSWPGRIQEFQRGNRRIWVDGAHNPAGVAALRQTLMARPGWRPMAVIFGTFSDKNPAALLEELKPIASHFYFVPVQSPRSASPIELQAFLAGRPGNPVASTVCLSLDAAIALTVNEPAALITGSLYLVGEAIDLLEPHQPGEYKDDERALNHWTVPPAAQP